VGRIQPSEDASRYWIFMEVCLTTKPSFPKKTSHEKGGQPTIASLIQGAGTLCGERKN
tara:strand:- start:791 stop:964 length:174 start_codon:yes stop_codon:yes gene_type:complete